MRVALDGGPATPAAVLPSLTGLLAGASAEPPQPRSGPLGGPQFLGLIPTRGCNLACRYCDFMAPTRAKAVMNSDTAVAAIDGYLDLLIGIGQNHGQIQFFGGEPFYAADVVQFAVEYTRDRATGLSLTASGSWFAGNMLLQLEDAFSFTNP